MPDNMSKAGAWRAANLRQKLSSAANLIHRCSMVDIRPRFALTVQLRKVRPPLG